MTKKILTAILIGFNLIANYSFGQCSQYTCNSNGCVTSFSDQYCWFKNFVCWNFYWYKSEKVIKIPENIFSQYLNYQKGSNDFYLDKQHMAWGNNWFACRNGGVALRWQSGTYPKMPDLDWNKVEKMSASDIAKLSAVEKLDIFLGNKNFDITRFELKYSSPLRGRTSDDGWCGFCNGARASGAILPEPKFEVDTFSTINKNIKVTFYPTDIKAISAASYYYTEKYAQFGTDQQFETGSKCDANPSLFDFLLRFYLAEYKLPFFVDVSYTPAKFNETVLGYTRAITKTRAPVAGEFSNGSIKKVVSVNLTLYSEDEVDISFLENSTTDILSSRSIATAKINPIGKNTWVKTSSYSYDLYVDDLDNIVDGIWTSIEPIDYMWIAAGKGTTELHENETVSPKGNPHLKFDSIYPLIRRSSR